MTTIFEFLVELLFLFVIVAIPVVLIALITRDWDRAERIEEAMEYDPEPIHGEGRFADADDLRRAGW